MNAYSFAKQKTMTPTVFSFADLGIEGSGNYVSNRIYTLQAPIEPN